MPYYKMMNTKKLIVTTLAALMCTPSIYASPEAQAQMAQALEQQIKILSQIEPILQLVSDKTSAEKNAPKLQQLTDAYQQAKMDEDSAERKLTDREEDAIEAKYDRQLDKLEDKVEDLAEKIYERKDCYGSNALRKAIYHLCD